MPMLANVWGKLKTLALKINSIVEKILSWINGPKDLIAELNTNGVTKKFIKIFLTILLRSALVGILFGIALVVVMKLAEVFLCLLLLFLLLYAPSHNNTQPTIYSDYFRWTNLANCVCIPVMQTFFETAYIDTDSLIPLYDTADAFTFALPRILNDKDAQFQLERKLARKYAMYSGIPYREVIKNHLVMVCSEHAFIK